MTSLTDENGLTTSYEYCTTEANCLAGRLKGTVYPEGNKVHYAYDARGNVTEIRQISKTPGTPPDIVTTTGYSADCSNIKTCNRPIWTGDALGNQTDYAYDGASGQLLTVTLPAAANGVRPQTRYAYAAQFPWYKNAAGALVQAPAPISVLTGTSTCLAGATCAGSAAEQVTATNYQVGSPSVPSNLLPVSTTVASGNGVVSATASFGYDTVGNVTSIDGPLPGAADTTMLRYDAMRRPIGTVGPDPDGAGARLNLATRTTYDDRGRVSVVEQGTTAGQTDPAWAAFSPSEAVVRTYDAGDRVLSEALRSGSAAYALKQYGYDAKGRLDCVALRMNPAIYGSLPAGACSAGQPGSHGPDRVTKYSYSATDEVTQVQAGYGTTAAVSETIAYTPNGNTAHVIDAKNNRTTYEYDGHDRLVRTRYPVPTAGANSSSATDYEQLSYGDNVRVTSRRLRDGQSIGYGYDNLDRLVLKDVPNGSPNTFDVAYTYDLLGNLTRAQDSSGNYTSMTHDALGRKVTEASSWYSHAHQYDAAGRRTRITHGDGLYIQYDYDTAGNMTAVRENGAASGIGVLAQYSYDNRGRRVGVVFGNGASKAYTYDPVSRLAQLTLNLSGTVQDVATSFSYNPASQIVQATRTNDAYAWTGRYNVNRSYSANGLNQYTVSGANAVGHDARGNLTAAGSSSYSYTAENRLTTFPGASSGFAYDPLGRLQYEDGQLNLQYDGDQLLAELSMNNNSIARRYVHGPGVDEPIVWYEGSGVSDRRFLMSDERGSIVAVVDASGAALAINRFDEFGMPQASNLGRFQYTGQVWLREAGLHYYKARMYSFSLGRFMQADPIGYGDGMNMYAYAGNDSVNKTDPSGRCGQSDRTWPHPCPDEIVVIGGPNKPSSPNGGMGLPNAGNLLNGHYRGGSAPPGLQLPRMIFSAAEDASPSASNCSAGATASGLADAMSYSGNAHELFEQMAKQAGGQAAAQPFLPVKYMLQFTGVAATAGASLLRGEPADVAYVRAGAPIAGGALGGTLGGFAGMRMLGRFGAPGRVVGAFGGSVTGSYLGDRMGTLAAEQYARSKGYGGC